MSLTTHSEGQMSTVAASSSSVSSPSSSLSQGPNHRYKSTASILFSVLIVFLSVFGIFMMAGIILHYVMARRRQLIRGELENIRQSRLHSQKPEMWDVWPELSTPSNGQQKWKALNPLSAHVDASPWEDNPQRLKTAIRPFTARLAMQLTHDVVFNRPLVLPSAAAEIMAPTTPAAKTLAPGTGIQVAVLIAMPRHRTNLPSDLFTEKGDREPEESLEYVIGSTRTYVE